MSDVILSYNANNFLLRHVITKSPQDIATHIHDCYELYYFISGDITYYIEGNSYKVNSNDLILTNSKELHRILFNSDSTYERKFIHFKPEYVSSFQIDGYNMLNYFDNRKLGYFNKIEAKDVIESGIDNLWKEIEGMTPESTPENQVIIKALFVQILVKISKIFSKYNNPIMDSHQYDTKIISILDFINKNLSEKLSLDLLQQKFFVNKYYLCHIFKINTGFTVMEYITYKRIMKSIELMLSGVSVLNASHTVGFSDYSSFYRAFKNITGISPKQYAKK
jgi:AraC-like DNA-binding protein/mannose-6-phosphate isomerase-like protein (cupin superfamily)